MSLEFSAEEALERVRKYMDLDYHWGPSILQVMREVNGESDDSMFWAGVNFYGGITRHREGVCGAVSAMAVYTGFRFRSAYEDEAARKQALDTSRSHANRLAQEFKDRFGSLVCREILNIPDGTEEDVKRYMDSPERKALCDSCVRFIVERLYDLG